MPDTNSGTNSDGGETKKFCCSGNGVSAVGDSEYNGDWNSRANEEYRNNVYNTNPIKTI
jgi:hypothetical protein